MSPDSQLLLPVILPLGLVPLGLGLWQLWRELSPRKWLRVPGTIAISNIHLESSRTGRYHYTTTIQYDYRFKDHDFTSSCRRPNNFALGWRAEAEAIVARYPVGANVTVFVHPERPNYSVLECGVTPMSWIPLILGAILTAAALLSLIDP